VSSTDRSFALLVLTSLLVTPLGWVYYLWLIAAHFSRSAGSWRLACDHGDLGPDRGPFPGALWPLFLIGRWESAWADRHVQLGRTSG
jgi:hypothetical protein